MKTLDEIIGKTVVFCPNCRTQLQVNAIEAMGERFLEFGCYECGRDYELVSAHYIHKYQK